MRTAAGISSKTLIRNRNNEKLDIDTRVYFAGASSWNDVIDSLRFDADVR